MHDKNKKIDDLERKAWLLRRNYMKQSSRLRCARSELDEKANRGDLGGIIASISSIIRSGKDKLKPALLSFVSDILKSAVVRDGETGQGERGVRWKETSKQIFAVMQKKGKESLVRFYRSTLDGASEATIRRQWAKGAARLLMGEHLSNFVMIGEIYAPLMEKHNIVGPVPYELQEDETHINGRVAYDQANDKPTGTCGFICDGHKCDANFHHEPLGSGVEAYHAIMDFGMKEQRAFYLRVVTICPLHPKLPALPVVVHPTCLRFDCDWIMESWARLESFCESALASSLGPVPQGHGSDGAAPLVAAMKKEMCMPPGDGRFHLDAPGLVITGKVKEVAGVKHVTGLHMQDPRHCLSLLFGNGLDNDGKDTMMGKFPASISDHRVTARLAEAFSSDDHGAIKRFLQRTDSQNKTGPSVMCALKMQSCMEKAVNGRYNNVKQPFEGTLAYIRMLSRFILVFFGAKQSAADRARHAGYFAGLLRRARWHVKTTSGLFLKDNFVPSQTYQHAILAVQVAVLKLKAQHDYHANLQAHIEESGSNSVEKVFSQTGGFGAVLRNQRDFNAQEGLLRISDIITLEKYGAQYNGLDFGEESRETQRDLKPHLHEDQGLPDADPSLLCDDPTLISSWAAGDDEAKAAAKALGMEPPSPADWWEKPWLEEGNDIAAMKQESAEHEANSNNNGDGDGDDNDGGHGGGGGDGGENGGGGGKNGDGNQGADGTDDINDDEAGDLVQSLTALAARPAQKKSPLVDVPGGGRIYKQTLINEFNKTNGKISKERLSRIKASSSTIAEVEAAQREKAASAAASSAGGGGGTPRAEATTTTTAAATATAMVAAAATTATAVPTEGARTATASRGGGGRQEEEEGAAAAHEVIVGSDVAFAMIEGSASSPRYVWWIGRVSKVFRGKHSYRQPVPLDGDLPAEITVVCEWYSPIDKSGRLNFHFRKVSDRTKYSFLHFIGLVRIDVQNESNSSSSSSSSSSSCSSSC